MFVAIASFPEVPTDRRDEFHAWFAWSNTQLRGTDGLEGRRLLRTTDGAYVALVEHRRSSSVEHRRSSSSSSPRAHAAAVLGMATHRRPSLWTVPDCMSKAAAATTPEG